jgi:hypothetical protein
MRAIVATRRGGSEVLELQNVPAPASALARIDPPLLLRTGPPTLSGETQLDDGKQAMISRHATKASLLYLPPLVLSPSTSRSPSAGLQQAGVPIGAAAKEASYMAEAES